MKAHLVLAGLLLLASSCGGDAEPTPTEPPAPTRAPNPITLDDWANTRGQPELTGRAGGEVSDALHLRWTFPTEAGSISSPVIADGNVFVGNDAGKVVAISLDAGQEIWSTVVGDPPGAPIQTPPLVADDQVLVGDADGALWCLDAADGTVRWSFVTNGPIVGSAAIVGTGTEATILLASHDTHLYGLDREGKERWRYAGDHYFNAMPAVSDGRAFVGGCDAFLHVVDATSGAGIAKHEVGSYVAASSAIVGNRAFVGHMDGRVVCLDVESGEHQWVYGTRRMAYASSPAVDDAHVVIGNRDGMVHCIDRETGEGKWTFPTGGDVDGSPILCGSRVVVGSEGGRVYVLDLATGEATWSYDVGAKILSNPAVAGGFVVVMDTDGVVHAFAPR